MKLKINRNLDSIKGRISYYKSKNYDFVVKNTGYTTEIIHNGISVKYLTIEQEQSKRLFSYAKRIKNDVENSNIIIDQINPYFIDYFDCEKPKRLPEKVINVDIKSAYLTTLLNAGLITVETFAILSGAEKIERLKSVGMLATSKFVYTYENGKIVDIKREMNENNRNIFFYISMKVDEIMKELKKRFKKDFLFYWVDGIYFNENVNLKKVERYFIENKYLFSVTEINEPIIKIENGLFYFKYTDKKEKVKTFHFPINDNENRKKIRSYFNEETTQKRIF